MNIEIKEKSIIGSREDQQDNYYSFSDNEVSFAVVCDGMGGSAGGGLASQIVVDKLKELVHEKSPKEYFPDFFLWAVDILDESVVSLQKQSETCKSGTTIVAAAIENEKLYWLSVGDSRLYILRDEEIVQVTRDHNYELSLEQLLDTEVPVNHRLDALISFIGVGGVKIYDINKKGLDLLPGDKILLTTDGLTKVLNDNEIYNILKAEDEKELDMLFDTASKRSIGNQDNTTCVLINIDNGGSYNG